jgi:MFS family permease
MAVLTAGIGIGSAISSRFGRRMTVFVMSAWALCMVPIVVTASSWHQFLAGRCLNSVYIGMEMSVIPVFQSEIVPAPVRGLAVASYQMAFAFGGFIISGICHRTSTIPNDWSWRIPFLCYLFGESGEEAALTAVPSVVGSLIWFQPESPRWLVSKGRVDEARRALTQFRKSGHDIEHELEQIALAVETERNTSKGSYVACFRGRNLRRTMVVFGVNFFIQATGQAFGSLYGALLMKSLGTINPFNYTLLNNGLTALMYLIVSDLAAVAKARTSSSTTRSAGVPS